MNLCKCGCGGTPSKNHRFLRGHNRKGSKLSPEQRQKISDALRGRPNKLKGRKLSAAHRRKIREAIRRQAANPERFRALQEASRRPEVLARKGETMKKRWSNVDPETRRAIMKHAAAGKHSNYEVSRRIEETQAFRLSSL